MHIFFEYNRKCKNSNSFDAKSIEKTAERICKYFLSLKGVYILLYFHHNLSWIGAAAEMFPLNYPNPGIEFPYLNKVISEYSHIDFAIHFSSIVTYGDEITKVLNISHEFQHVDQYNDDRKIYLYGCIIRHFLKGQIPLVEIPIEYDANRMSKIIAYDMCGKVAVKNYIQSMLSDTKIKNKEYPKNFISINIHDEFNLKDEILRLWEANEIEKKVEVLKKYSLRDVDQESVIEMYDFANK